MLLWPGGFGAQPERAILLLIGGMVFFAVVYWGYIRLYEAQYRMLLTAVRNEARNFARLRKPSPEGDDDKLVTAAEMLSGLERHDEAIRIIREEIAPELRLRAGDSRRLRLAVDRLLQRAGAPFGETRSLRLQRLQ